MSRAAALARQPGRPFDFGIAAPADAAAVLRKFADDIEFGRVVLQEVRGIDRAKNDEYFMRTLILRYAEKHP